MKYIITAKEMYEGTSKSDFATPLKVTEIATELVITRLACIMLLKDGIISTSDTIVTNSDRKCLYTNVFENVISWKEFVNLKSKNIETIDLLSSSTFNRLASGPVETRKIPYLPFYQNWERDKEEIINIEKSDLLNYDMSEEFHCLLIRTRGAWPEKNLEKQYWDELISKIKKQKENIFVFGKETNVYADERVQYVESFKDWCSIVSHQNCKTVTSTITGGVYPVFIVGNPNLKLIIVDNLDLVKKYGYDPSWYNDCINFTGVKKIIIDHKPTTEQLMEIINE